MNCKINNNYTISKFKCNRSDETYCDITKNNFFYQQILE